MRLSGTITGSLIVLMAFQASIWGVPISVAGVSTVSDASAKVRTYKDRQGRPIRISSESPAAKPSTYAKILRNSVHGSEISSVTVRIVTSKALTRVCGGLVGGCYKGSSQSVVVPAKSALAAESVLLHEYGHHIDQYVRGVGPELNGGRHWYRALKLGRLVKQGKLGYGHGLPWSKRISEVWAENYAGLHVDSSFCLRPTGCLTTKGRRAIIRDIMGKRPRVRKPRTVERSVDVGKKKNRNITVTVRRTGGKLLAKAIPEVEIPEDGATCNINLLRNGKILDLAAGLGTVTLKRRHAVGGKYVVQINGSSLGCKGKVRILVP